MKGLSCPKCRFALTKSEKMQRECPNCSVIFEKYKSVQAARRKREDELNRADKFSNSLTGKEKMYVQWDIRWNYIKEMLHKLGVYEFVIKLIGLIALFITVSGIVYIVTSFYGSNDNSSSSNEKNKISASAGNWYEGGTLHKSNVSAWNSATYKNKLATAADWVLTSPSVKKIVLNSGDMNTTKTYAIELVVCIDTATDGIELINTKRTTEIVASCMVIMDYL